ncbi:ATP-dependent DNA helicase PIF1 [Fusarium albosuccineum]|uniref:ATP-dependent DNA helicase PIF1 n=1 Tax=Fusarium albosuccineum TaxID=1237068 RepID=A0A8H4LF58_9HYPO|nr:ATP-dependent DNA helicase PIF1 [Fusarium albosuccineum]
MRSSASSSVPSQSSPSSEAPIIAIVKPPVDGKKAPSDHPDLPSDTRTCNRRKETKSLAHVVNLKDRNKLTTRSLVCRDRQDAPSRAWTRFRSISRSTSASPAPPAPPAPSKRNVSAVQSPEHPARHGVQPTSPEPSMSGLLPLLPRPAQTEPPALARPPLRRRVASATPSEMPEMRPQDTPSRRLLSSSMQRTASGIEFFRRVILSPVEAGDGDDDGFACELCDNQRPNHCRHEGTDTCIYCAAWEAGREDPDEEDQDQVCASCLHTFKRREFLLYTAALALGHMAQKMFNHLSLLRCLTLTPTCHLLGLSITAVVDNGLLRQAVSQSEAASEDILPDAAFNDQLNQPCLTLRDRQLIANWQEAMDTQFIQYCPRCMYRYKGHVINFLKDIGHLYRQLPLLPKDLDIIVLRSANQTTQPHIVRRSSKQFRVRQRHVRTWLEFLRANHSGYRDIDISEENLSQPPQDGDVTDQLVTGIVDSVDIEELFQDDDPNDLDHWDTAAVPNFIAQQRDLTTLRNRLQGRHEQPDIPLETGQPYLEMPGIRSTPLNEFNRSQALLSLAFPTLFPIGEGYIVEPREWGVL